MTKKVLEAQEKICDIAGGGAPGRVVCAMGVDAGDFAWADERGSANEIEVAVSPESHLSIGVICAGFWEMWPVLPIDQGLAATGRETWDPDVVTPSPVRTAVGRCPSGMKRGKQEGPRYWGPSCLRPCCTFTPASAAKSFRR